MPDIIRCERLSRPQILGDIPTQKKSRARVFYLFLSSLGNLTRLASHILSFVLAAKIKISGYRGRKLGAIWTFLQEIAAVTKFSFSLSFDFLAFFSQFSFFEFLTYRRRSVLEFGCFVLPGNNQEKNFMYIA